MAKKEKIVYETDEVDPETELQPIIKITSTANDQILKDILKVLVEIKNELQKQNVE